MFLRNHFNTNVTKSLMMWVHWKSRLNPSNFHRFNTWSTFVVDRWVGKTKVRSGIRFPWEKRRKVGRKKTLGDNAKRSKLFLQGFVPKLISESHFDAPHTICSFFYQKKHSGNFSIGHLHRKCLQKTNTVFSWHL